VKKSRDELGAAWQCSSMHEIKDLSMVSFISPPSSKAALFHKNSGLHAGDILSKIEVHHPQSASKMMARRRSNN